MDFELEPNLRIEKKVKDMTIDEMEMEITSIDTKLHDLEGNSITDRRIRSLGLRKDELVKEIAIRKGESLSDRKNTGYGSDV